MKKTEMKKKQMLRYVPPAARPQLVGFFEVDYRDSCYTGDDTHSLPKFDESIRGDHGDSASASKVSTHTAVAEPSDKEVYKGSPARDKACAGSPVVESKTGEVVADLIGTEESTDTAADQFVVFMHNTAQDSVTVDDIAHQPLCDPAVHVVSEGVHDAPGATDVDADIGARQHASAATQNAPDDHVLHETEVQTEAPQIPVYIGVEHEFVSRVDTPTSSELSPVKEHLDEENTENIGKFYMNYLFCQFYYRIFFTVNELPFLSLFCFAVCSTYCFPKPLPIFLPYMGENQTTILWSVQAEEQREEVCFSLCFFFIFVCFYICSFVVLLFYFAY